MEKTRSLSAQESKVVLTLTEQHQWEVTRQQVIELLGSSPKAADHVIASLRRKGWLQRATWGEYLLVPPEQGPDALGDSNLLALASRIADPYYIGFGTTAANYGLTTQLRRVIFVVTTVRLRPREVGESRVRIVNLTQRKFFGFAPVDVLGYKVMISDREKTAIDCIDRPDLSGGVSEAAMIFGNACRRFDWTKVTDYLQRIDSAALVRRLGWLADHVKADVPPHARERLMHLAAQSRKTWLGPDPVRDGLVAHGIGYDKNWGLLVNVAREELHGSAGLGQQKTIRRGG